MEAQNLKIISAPKFRWGQKDKEEWEFMQAFIFSQKILKGSLGEQDSENLNENRDLETREWSLQV